MKIKFWKVNAMLVLLFTVVLIHNLHMHTKLTHHTSLLSAPYIFKSFLSALKKTTAPLKKYL